MDADDLRRLEFTVAQLRHLYSHLVNGRVTKPIRLAEGLLAPEIRRLEELLGKAQKQRQEP